MKSSYFTLKENKKLMVLFLALFTCVIISLGYIYRSFFWPFLFSIIFYIALRPVFDLFSRIIKKRFISSTLVIILLFVLVIFPSFFLLISLTNQAYDFYIYIQQHFDAGQLQKFINDIPFMQRVYSFFGIQQGEVLQKGIELLQQTSFTIFSNLTDILTFSLKFTVNFFFMLLILFFLFKDGYKLEEPFYRILPFPDDIEKDVVARLKQVIKILLAGNLIIIMLQGLMLGLGFYLFGLGMPILWGSIAAVLSLIPLLGTALVWLPGVIYLAATGNYAMALLLGIWCLFWYLFLENFVKPNIFGKKLKFHPLIFFFLLIGSIQSFGLSGILIGPVLLTLFFSLWEIYSLVSGYKKETAADEDNPEGTV